MPMINKIENKIRCGKCGTEFDLNVNPEGCPLCGFGKQYLKETNKKIPVKGDDKFVISSKYLDVPPSLELTSGEIKTDDETQTWGSWLMFNDFFAPKFLARILAWKMHSEEADHITLSSLMKDAINIVDEYGLSQLKGFPNLKKDWNGQRLVNHFLRTFSNMGFFKVEPMEKDIKNIWKEDWDKIKVTLTKEGLEFSQLKNPVFDDNKHEQILYTDEKNWLLNYLKEIDSKGYKEYSILKEVYEFLKEGHNGNQDLWDWFSNNEKFRNYILQRSKRAREQSDVFEKQLKNYSRSFSSAKLSLLRELGIVKNKRNDYTVIGEM